MTDTLTHRNDTRYEAPGVSGAPRLAGLPGVDRCDGPDESTIEVFHYDTDDLRLARAGVSVSRIVQHPGTEWSLQQPTAARAGGDSTAEGDAPEGATPLRVPQQDGDDVHAVPEAIRSLIRVHTRGRDLAPVAHTQTSRAVWRLLDWEGGVLGEITGDAVSAQTLETSAKLGSSSTVDSWYQVTVSLATPAPRLLGALEERLGDIGAQPAKPRPVLQRLIGSAARPAPDRTPRRKIKLSKKARAGEVLLAALSKQVARLHECDGMIRRDEPDAIHQMRVATRRMRSTLRAYGRVVDSGATTAVNEELRWLCGALSGARDQEVIQERVEAALAATPDEDVLGPLSATLSKQFARERTEAHAHVLAELDTDRYFALLDALESMLADLPLTPFARGRGSKVLPALAGRAAKKLDKAVAAVDQHPEGPERDTAIHSVRKKAKRARYAADLLEPVAGKDATRSAKRFKAVQSQLGDHQDAVQTRLFLRKLGGRGHLAGQNGFTVGIWYEQEARAAEDADNGFDAVCRRAASRKHRRWMR